MIFAAALPFVRVDPDSGRAQLDGCRCTACGVVLVGGRAACPACHERASLEPISLAGTGALQTFSIVHRSYPGVQTPFIAAVVELDGGGAVKGTLRHTEPDPSRLALGMPVTVRFEDTGQRDREGRALVCYYFDGAAP
jgi:uncharacterized OB-fold protein